MKIKVRYIGDYQPKREFEVDEKQAKIGIKNGELELVKYGTNKCKIKGNTESSKKYNENSKNKIK